MLKLELRAKELLVGATAVLALSGCESGAKMMAGTPGSLVGKAAGIPQLNAFLPIKTKVEPGEVMPIDGYWEIVQIAKQIQIDRGRAYAVEGWLHMLTLRVQPNMVVIRNIEEVGPGVYEADDLPLLGRATMVVQPDETIAVTVKSRTGETKYTLAPVDYEDPEPVEKPAEERA